MEKDTLVFNSNMCFICHKSTRDTILKQCSRCKMISYCGKTHQRKHWKKHKVLCGVIQKVTGMIQPINLEDNKNWYTYRTNFMMLCELQMNRKLEPFEINMILFPNCCQICRSRAVKETCQNCLCGSYCSVEHKQADFSFHSQICNDLALSVKVDLYLDETGFYPVYNLRESNIELTDKIETFINSNITIVDSTSNDDVILKTLLSELITCPLSLISALKSINFEFRDNSVLHILGSSTLETASLKSWEIIPHIHSHVKNLIVYFIGPEVSQFEEELCASCQNIITFKYSTDFYHDFINSDQYQLPDVICAFNCGFHEYEDTDSDTWLKSLPLLVKNSNTPLVITSFVEDEADRDIRRLKTVKDNLDIQKMDNPFASLRPYRDLESLGVYFNNKFVCTILNDSSKQ